MITRKNTKTLTGAQIIVESLKSFGTDTVFGYPGGMVLPLYDELSRQTDIKHILVRHEQSAVHAAEGYARVSGKCGVVLVTSGPGATNTVTGIVNAYLDGYPLIILTGQVNSNLIGKDAFQEANICDITNCCHGSSSKCCPLKSPS
jgi:acetolactate synthase-1/2/3 large subunit